MNWRQMVPGVYVETLFGWTLKREAKTWTIRTRGGKVVGSLPTKKAAEVEADRLIWHEANRAGSLVARQFAKSAAPKSAAPKKSPPKKAAAKKAAPKQPESKHRSIDDDWTPAW